MSSLYLPNGAQIEIYNGWSQQTDEHGTVSYYSKDKKYLGCITKSGVVHLTDECKKTYYPPSLSSADDAVKLLINNKEKMRSVLVWHVAELKSILSRFDAKKKIWK